MIEVKKRPKYKTHNPITFAVPANQKKIIKAVPRASFKRFKTNTANATDWYNITFRVKVAYELAIVCYTQETQAAIKEVLDLLLAVKDRRPDDKTWVISEEEAITIESGLDAMDAIEDDTTRRVQLDATYKAKYYLEQFLGKTSVIKTTIVIDGVEYIKNDENAK